MKRKFLLIVLVITLVTVMLVDTVSASSFIATMTASKTAVSESTEFTVTVKVSNIDAGANGINSVSGIFSYDTKIFETISTSSISGLNGWQPNYFPDIGKIVLFKPTYAKNDEDVLQVTLKTKASTAGKSGVVSFKSVVASNSEADIPASDISTTITVGNVASGSDSGNSSSSTPPANTNQTQQIRTSTVPITNNNTNNSTVNNNSNSTSNIVTPSTVNQSVNVSNVNSQTESDIPYTGASDNIMRAIFVVLVIAGVSYFKYESIKEN